MSSKITIIGAGSVGATIAYTLSSQDIASEIVLIDINKEKVADAYAPASAEMLLQGRYIIAQRGKKNYFLLIAK